MVGYSAANSSEPHSSPAFNIVSASKYTSEMSDVSHLNIESNYSSNDPRFTLPRVSYIPTRHLSISSNSSEYLSRFNRGSDGGRSTSTRRKTSIEGKDRTLVLRRREPTSKRTNERKALIEQKLKEQKNKKKSWEEFGLLY